MRILSLFLLFCLSAYPAWADPTAEERARSIRVLQSPEAASRAEEIFKVFKTEIEPQVEALKHSMEADNGTIRFHMHAREEQEHDAPEQLFRQDERLYIFMSSSVPDRVWSQYARQIHAAKTGSSVVFVLRGCIGGCAKVMPTIKYIQKILMDDGSVPNGLSVQVWIDPLLFRTYGIDQVPTMVYAAGVSLINTGSSEGYQGNWNSAPRTVKSRGDWALEHHLTQLIQGGAPLQPFLDKLSQGFYRGKP